MRRRLLVLQVAIVLLTVVTAGSALLAVQQREVRAAYRDQMLRLSQSVAQDPRVIGALGSADPASQIQPIAEVVRNATGVTYVVVTDAQGVRMSHPDPGRIGEMVSTDPSIPLAGQTYIGTQTGTLGRSWRVKVPVFDPDGSVIGTVSVGTLESTLSSQFLDEVTIILLVLGGAAALGVIGAAAATQLIRKRIYQLDPDDAAEMLRAHQAMLHGIREGVVAVDPAYRVRLVNDEAARLLDLDTADVEVGAPMEDILESNLAQLVRSGVTDDRLVLAGSRVLVARCDAAATDDHDTVGTVLMLRDRTDLHAVVRELDGAHSLTEGLRAQAHEHSNRLHVLLGLLELGETKEAMGFIRRTAAGGPLTGSQQVPGIADTEVLALLHSLVHRGVERNVEIEVTPSSTLASMSADESLQMDVLTVLANLVENALTACRLGGRVLVELEHDRSSAASRLTLRVEDDGPGIPPELAERIFDVGVTSKEVAGSGSMSAHGIGLALVRRIALRRGGSARAVPSRLGGSGFVVQLAAQAVVPDDVVLTP